MNSDDETKLYAQMGYAAMLPGMVRMLELMQGEIARARAKLAALQAGGKPAGRREPGRPSQQSMAAKGGWPDDPLARKREMAKRQKVAAANKKASSRSERGKKAWAEMAPATRRRRLAAMLAGRQKKEQSLKAVA